MILICFVFVWVYYDEIGCVLVMLVLVFILGDFFVLLYIDGVVELVLFEYVVFVGIVVIFYCW